MLCDSHPALASLRVSVMLMGTAAKERELLGLALALERGIVNGTYYSMS